MDAAVEGASDRAPESAEHSAEHRFVMAAAALSAAAGLIHASVIVSHFQEYWLFGVFFVGAATFQFFWGVAVWTRRDDRRLFVIGAVANLAIVLLWTATRTVGLPIGPEPGEVEAVGLHDLFATADEVALAVAAGIALTGGRTAERTVWLVPPLWILAVVSGITAFLGDHSA